MPQEGYLNGDTEEMPRVTGAGGSKASVPSRRNPARLFLLESILIIASVLLGFAIQTWGERQADRRVAEAALARFRVEIESNLEELERVQPKHALFAERLADPSLESSAVTESAFDVFVRHMPEGGLDTPPLREAAWETATMTGALSLLDYDLAAALSETYLIQRSTLAPTMALLRDRLISPPNFERRGHEALVKVHQMMLSEFAGQEAYPMEVYRRTLNHLAVADR